MQCSEKPGLELSKAKGSIDAMRNAQTLSEFEESWKMYLSSLERVWSKANHHYSKSPKWNGWKGKYESLRKKDPLLSYLINARGADEHTVNEIVERVCGGIGINPAYGNVLHIDELSIINNQISIKSPQPIKIEFIPSHVKLLPVLNRSRTYPVPLTHLGKFVDPNDVIDIAERGADFYDSFLLKAKEYFIAK